MSLRRPPAPERIVADVPLDRREALVLERLDTGKIVCWRCSRTPGGHTVLASAARAFSIPTRELGRIWPIFRSLDAEAQAQALKIRRAS